MEIKENKCRGNPCGCPNLSHSPWGIGRFHKGQGQALPLQRKTNPPQKMSCNEPTRGEELGRGTEVEEYKAERSDRRAQVLVELHAESGKVGAQHAVPLLKSHYQTKNFRTTPTVADLDGDGKNEIVVENAAGYIEALNPPQVRTRQRAQQRAQQAAPLQPTLRWKFRALAQPVWVTWKTWHAAVPAIDLDGNGKKEIICSDGGDEAHTTIYALRSDGSLYWKSELTEVGPRLSESFAVGRFRVEGWDVIVTIQATTQPEMLCLDGRTGKIRRRL